jgi:hypothetical protein
MRPRRPPERGGEPAKRRVPATQAARRQRARRAVAAEDRSTRLVRVILRSRLAGPLKRSLVAQLVRLEYGGPNEAVEASAEERAAEQSRWIYGLIVLVLGLALVATISFTFVLAITETDIPALFGGLAGGALAALAVIAGYEIYVDWRRRALREQRAAETAGQASTRAHATAAESAEPREEARRRS